MPRTTTYEVWIQSGPRWEIHARYPRWEHERAIEEAKHLERFHPMANIRVVREEYDSQTGLADELTVYASPRRKTTFAKGTGGNGGGSDRHWSETYGSDRQKQSGKRKVTHTGLFLMMSLLTLSGASIATVVSYLFSFYINKFSVFGLVGRSAQTNALYVIFLITFLVVTIALVSQYLSRVDLESLPERKRRDRPAARTTPMPEPLPETNETTPVASEWESPEELPSEDPASKDDPAEDAGKSESDEESDDQRIALTLAGEREKLRMMAFFGQVLDEAKATGVRLDTVARFGFNLFLAGASEALGNAVGLDRADIAGILQEAVELLGTQRNQAHKFAEGFEDYLLDTRHMAMFQSGRQAMAPYLEGKTEAMKNIVPALNAWLNPEDVQQDPDRPIAVMFTDMVGSTDQTQAFGDLAAQYVLRAHNRLVRSALSNHGGKEIKHLGDGIMASFISTADAVRAAIEIQRRVIANNDAEKDLPFPLHVRIGINSGQTVSEDNDLFGATVQLASRLCATGESDEIVVSDSVRVLCANQALQFVPMEERVLKGFKEPIAPFSVTWRDIHPDEPIRLQEQTPDEASSPQNLSAASVSKIPTPGTSAPRPPSGEVTMPAPESTPADSSNQPIPLRRPGARENPQRQEPRSSVAR